MAYAPSRRRTKKSSRRSRSRAHKRHTKSNRQRSSRRRRLTRSRSGKSRSKKTRSSRKRGIAIKTNPKLWKRARKAACTEGKLCKHSARKMQFATAWYKRHGGRYKGKKSASNRLTRWGRQKWRTSSRKKSGGKRRYLPDKAWRALTPAQKRRANSSKRRGYSKGNQYVKNPKDVARISRRYRR